MQLIGHNDGLSLSSDGRLIAKTDTGSTLSQLLLSKQARIAGGNPPTHNRFRIARRRPSMHFDVEVSYLPLTGGFSPTQAGTWMLLIRDADTATGTAGAQLSAAFQLTPAETRLTTKLVEGQSLKDACGKLGITYNTGRAHLRNILSKTESRSQADLVRRCLARIPKF